MGILKSKLFKRCKSIFSREKGVGLQTPSFQSLVEPQGTWGTRYSSIALLFMLKETGARVLPSPDTQSHTQKPSSLGAPDDRTTHGGRDFSRSRRPTSFFPRDAFASLCQDTPSTAGASSPRSGLQPCRCAPFPATRRAPTAAGWRTPTHVHCSAASRSPRNGSINPSSQ